MGCKVSNVLTKKKKEKSSINLAQDMSRGIRERFKGCISNMVKTKKSPKAGHIRFKGHMPRFKRPY